jgi:hypothetical protein
MLGAKPWLLPFTVVNLYIGLTLHKTPATNKCVVDDTDSNEINLTQPSKKGD